MAYATLKFGTAMWRRERCLRRFEELKSRTGARQPRWRVADDPRHCWLFLSSQYAHVAGIEFYGCFHKCLRRREDLVASNYMALPKLAEW